MAKTIKIAGIHFNANFFNAYMKNIFGESFAHSSLSFEKVFSEGKEYGQQLISFMNDENTKYSRKLESGNQEDLQLLKQRYEEITYALKKLGIPEKRIEINENEFTPCIADFAKYYPGIVRPYRNTNEYNYALENNQLTGEKYEQETLLSRIQLIISLVSKKIQADQTAYNLKKGNNEAFTYARSLPKISIKDIIKINAMVNNESGIHTGFKTSDNDIINAPFKPCPKEMVPIKMQELMHKYNNEWAQEIPEFIEGVSTTEEKNAYLKAVCEREAKFHIEFERIHPFEDGNGRTGRIILNAHLIANELAPILITPEMHEMYIQAIDYNDYKTLGQFIFVLSSVCLTEMVSQYRKARGVNPDELTLTPSSKVKKALQETIEPDYKPLSEAEETYYDDDIKIYPKLK